MEDGTGDLPWCSARSDHLVEPSEAIAKRSSLAGGDRNQQCSRGCHVGLADDAAANEAIPQLATSAKKYAIKVETITGPASGDCGYYLCLISLSNVSLEESRYVR